MEQTPDLNHIEIFIRVAELRSFTAVSVALGVPKSTVSRAISHLEEDLKSQLFYRNTRQIELTSLGKMLYANCREQVDALKSGIKNTLDQSRELEGTIRITSVDDIGTVVLTPVLARFAERYPKLTIDMVFTSEVLDLIRGSVDVALRVGKTKQQSYRVRKVGDIEFILVASPRYLERFPRKLLPKDLSDTDFVAFSEFQTEKKGVTLVNGPDTVTVKVPVRFNSTNTASILELVKAGMGIGLLPDFMCSDPLKKETLLAVCKGWHTKSMPVSLVTPAHKKESPAVKLFTDFLYENLKDVFC